MRILYAFRFFCACEPIACFGMLGCMGEDFLPVKNRSSRCGGGDGGW